jgi:hypothetical protein
MPKVGDKHFAYTAKGKKQAVQHAKKTGQAVTQGRKKSTAKRAY